ncbi:hypothetical protein [Sphaerisporangium corydalis]|uniref:Peptidase M15B domain-containing protein n=1 Tax=Sphaerisporangium corydalis TaxID=1441875 RepID=A0ABV9EH06_9ACTN|nr:hypothetical protein [Sphaerisporangium corydalis]
MPVNARAVRASGRTATASTRALRARARAVPVRARAVRAKAWGGPVSGRNVRLRGISYSMPGRTADTTRARRTVVAQARARMVGAMMWRQHRRFRAVRLQHPQATRRLRLAGLRWRSSGHCVDRLGPSCTSLASVRLGTLWGLVNLRHRSHCPLTVTGGTETGHAGGRYSHGNGYKIDIAHNRCVDRYVRRKRAGQVRRDGARLFYERHPQGYTVYANEPSHWDILFR